MAGGVIAAVIALTVLGFGIKSYRTGAIPASGLAIGLAMTLMGSFVASLAGGIVAAFHQQAPEFEGLRTAIGSATHLIDGLGFGLTVLLFVELASRARPARGHR